MKGHRAVGHKASKWVLCLGLRWGLGLGLHLNPRSAHGMKGHRAVGRKASKWVLCLGVGWRSGLGLHLNPRSAHGMEGHRAVGCKASKWVLAGSLQMAWERLSHVAADDLTGSALAIAPGNNAGACTQQQSHWEMVDGAGACNFEVLGIYLAGLHSYIVLAADQHQPDHCSHSFHLSSIDANEPGVL